MANIAEKLQLIRENSPEFQMSVAKLESRKIGRASTAIIFGATTLSGISALRKRDPYSAATARKIDQLLDQEKQRLYVASITGKVKNEYVKKFLRDGGRYLGRTSMLGEVSNLAFEGMLRHHVNQQRNRSREFDQVLPSLKIDFSNTIMEEVRMGRLKLDSDLFYQRMRSVRIRLIDPLMLDSLILEKKYAGWYEPENHRVNIVSGAGRDAKQTKYILNHELTHAAVAGRDYVLEGTQSDQPHILRIGLGIYEYRNSELVMGSAGLFSDIDEGVTEGFNVHKFGTNLGAYRDERSIIEQLCRRGSFPIPESAFLDAYTENDTPGRPYDLRLTDTRRLHQLISSAFTPGFLLDVDAYIKRRGVSECSNALKSNWQAISGACGIV